MSNALYRVPDDWGANASIDAERCETLYRRSVQDPEGFWGEAAKRLD